MGYFWGPRPSLTATMYRAAIRPFLLYGSVVWASRLTVALRNKLKQLNRLALLCIAPVLHGMPTAGLEVVYSVEPLDLFIQDTAAKTLVRIGSPSGCRSGHRAWLKRKFGGLISQNSDYRKVRNGDPFTIAAQVKQTSLRMEFVSLRTAHAWIARGRGPAAA